MVFYCTFFFFNDTATTEIYTLSLHDALPIYYRYFPEPDLVPIAITREMVDAAHAALPELPTQRAERYERDFALSADNAQDRKSTRLNSSHANISYAVFCLKKKQNE